MRRKNFNIKEKKNEFDSKALKFIRRRETEIKVSKKTSFPKSFFIGGKI